MPIFAASSQHFYNKLHLDQPYDHAKGHGFLSHATDRLARWASQRYVKTSKGRIRNSLALRKSVVVQCVTIPTIWRHKQAQEEPLPKLDLSRNYLGTVREISESQRALSSDYTPSNAIYSGPKRCNGV